MKERPSAVTFFGWFWRVVGIAGLVFAWPLAFVGREWLGDLSSGPFWQLRPIFLFLYFLFVSVLLLVCGEGLLRGRNWSRVLVVATGIAAILIGFVWYENAPFFWINLFWDLVFTLVMWFLLYRPHVTAFFQGEVPLNEDVTA